MKTLAKLAPIFALACVMTGCVQSPKTSEASLPAAAETVAVETTKAATVDATTQIGGNYLYEVTPPTQPNTTCLVVSSIYTNSAVDGSLDCLPKPAQVPPRTAAATIQSATKIGTNTFYEVTPATRGDLICNVTSTIYTNNAVSGSIKCLPKTAP
jgi:hypothetical protein